jgi:tetratricopeptide (TPR) repeat protein
LTRKRPTGPRRTGAPAVPPGAAASPVSPGSDRAGASASPPEGTLPRGAGPAALSGGRLWAFRLLALALPLALLALLELSLRLLGVGTPTSFFLRAGPGSRAKGTQAAAGPAWIENQKFGWRFFPPALARAPEPLWVAQQKSSNTCRVVVFGESAALGDPAPDDGFSRVLEVLLAEQYPGVVFEVVNVAMTAISSHVVRQIAKDSVRLGGDVWIIYMGNNEVVGPYGAGTVFTAQAPSLAFIRAGIALKTTRLGQGFDRLLQGGPKSAEWEGMEMFLRQQVRQADPKMTVVHHNFQRNLEDILRLGTRSGARVLLCTVVANLKDCPPFASLHRPGLSDTDRAAWQRLYDTGVGLLEARKPAEALASFQAAAQIDGDYAELHFRLGQGLLLLGKADEARSSFTRALDLDTLRFRADTRINGIIRQAAREFAGVTLLDAAELVSTAAAPGLPGDDLLFEHVHLNFEGNYLLARAMAEELRPLLPEWVRRAAVAKPVLLSLEECGRRLGLTDWNRLQIAEEVRKRVRQPPFTHQAGHSDRDRRWAETVARLKSAETPAGLQQAVEVARAASQRRPLDWRLRSNLAKLLEAAGDPPGAARQWEEVRRLLPHGAEAPFHLGNLAQPGPGVDVAEYFREALRLKPDAVEVLNGLGLVLAADGKTSEAIQQFEKALALRPRFVEARVNLGQVLAGAGRLDEARRHYQTALAQDTNCVAAHINLGKLCAAQGAREEAVRHYQEALRVQPAHAVAHFNLGNTLSQLGRAGEALEHYQAAVQTRPDFAEARYNLGQALGQQGRTTEALEQLAQAVTLKPDWAEAHFNLGVALARAGRRDEAATQFREVLRLQPGQPAATQYLEQLQKRSSR